MSKLLDFETSKALKSLGFDERVQGRFYENQAETHFYNPINWNQFINYTSQPTQNEACDWLREKKNLSIEVSKKPFREGWFAHIINFDGGDFKIISELVRNDIYESAQLAGIELAIEYLKSKNMTRKEAYKEMQNGFKITHKYFDKSEYYFLKNGKIIAEDGVDHTHIFWKIDDNNWGETGWEIYVDDSK